MGIFVLACGFAINYLAKKSNTSLLCKYSKIEPFADEKNKIEEISKRFLSIFYYTEVYKNLQVLYLFTKNVIIS